MDNPAIHFTTVFMAFFAIMNPIANAPLFIGLTEDLDTARRRDVALRAVALAFAIVAVFAVLGRGIFFVFDITLPAFRIAGGILVGLVGYHLLQGRDSSFHAATEEGSRSREAAAGVAVTPLAMPILAGPGTIATAMNFAAESTLAEVLRVVSALALACALTWAAFVGSNSLVRLLGRSAISVVSRLMGLILAVVGVQMLIVGIRGAVAASPHP